jgi:hypothetical protein
VVAPGGGATEVAMEAQVLLVHWYDTERRQIACGAAGQSNSTKHIRGVTCTACLAVAGEVRGATHVGQDGASYVQ